jgi:PAS domain S-box-containing protein
MHQHDYILHSHHDPFLVALSITIAALASYTALDLAGRIRAATGRARLGWLAAAAVALGGGIWSMHFVAMLAFSIDGPISFDVDLTLLSLAVAIIVTGVGLFIVSRRRPSIADLLFAGVFTGLGVAAMHYTGMAALRVNADLSYDPMLFGLSLVIAVVAAIAALWLAVNLERGWHKAAAAIVMAAAIAGMHYTGMAAAEFTLADIPVAPPKPQFSGPLLAIAITVASFIVLFLGLLSSLIDRRFAEQAEREAGVLRRSEQRLRSLVQNGSDVIVVVSAMGRITYASSSSMRILGWPSELLTGKFFVDLTVPNDRKSGQTLLTTITHQPMANTIGHLDLVLADGTTRPFEIIGNDRREDAAVNGIVMNLRDISERKRVEDELRQARDKAEAASRAKSAFLANMSHELRTPLNAIIGFSELILNEGFGPIGNARYSDYIRDINTSGTHLLGIINNILDLSKAEANRLELHDDMVDLAEAVAMSVTTISGQAARNGLKILVDVPPNLPPLRADMGKMRQILINVLSNAAKFTQPGGHIAVKAGPSADGGLMLTVTDSGIGMAREKIAVAMEPFGQVDSDLNRQYEGTGLGLPLTKRLVELHDGTFDLESEPGWGTRVKIIFPAARVGAPPAASASLAS